MAIAQVATAQVTNAGTDDDIFTFTVTDQGGRTHTATYTKVSGDAAADVAAGMAAAWNNDQSPVLARVTASAYTDTVTLTADTAGQPFIASSSASGTGAVGAVTDTTDSSGPNDLNINANYLGNVKPDGNDKWIVPENTPAILWGLDQSGVALAQADIQATSNQIGGTDDAYLKITLATYSGDFNYKGTGQAWIDLLASDGDAFITNTARPGEGQTYGLKLRGTAITNLHVYRGTVGYGVDLDDTTSEVDKVWADGGSVSIGENVTDTGGGGKPDIEHSGGTVNASCPVGVVNRYSGAEEYTQVKNTWDTMTSFTDSGSIVVKGIGTYGTGDTELYSGSALDASQDTRAKTITKLIMRRGSEFEDSDGTFAHTNPVEFPDVADSNEVTFNFGSARKLTVADL